MTDVLNEAIEHMRHAHRLLLRARPHIDYALGHYLEWALPADVEEARGLLDAIDALRLETQRLGPAGGINSLSAKAL